MKRQPPNGNHVIHRAHKLISIGIYVYTYACICHIYIYINAINRFEIISINLNNPIIALLPWATPKPWPSTGSVWRHAIVFHGHTWGQVIFHKGPMLHPEGCVLGHEVVLLLQLIDPQKLRHVHLTSSYCKCRCKGNSWPFYTLLTPFDLWQGWNRDVVVACFGHPNKQGGRCETFLCPPGLVLCNQITWQWPAY